jgi:hypothetical protein
MSEVKARKLCHCCDAAISLRPEHRSERCDAGMGEWESRSLSWHRHAGLTAYGEIKLGVTIGRFAVDLSLCRPATDFGRGFYTTTSLRRAKEAPAGVRPGGAAQLIREYIYLGSRLN